ncbi:hypothetical protein G7Y89_g14415 [Cudoniella acicularis]|uniref:DUF7580 domain-containing protein n=1 Tax=Cudoniella acicularis TaxID=354080 RepID=A0A8H4VVY9_9HELO|nr:hypothetical protein G7Y89_g14415 [Cudoniella acicularis]
MSGMEVVGLILGILPLMISAAEHYDDVIRPFKRYKNYSAEVKRFQDELLSEKVIYNTESLLLLASVTNYDVATKMLEDRDHPSWKDSELENKLLKVLGASHEACKNVISLIDSDLNQIKEECQFFDTVKCGSSVPTNKSDKAAWRHRIGRKLKFSLSESHLDSQLKDLRRHVKLFQRHSSQINRVIEKQKNTQKHQEDLLTNKAVADRQVVQEAAAKLYQALVDACKVHQEHLLHFRLETHHSSSTGRSFVRFQMAFIQIMPNGTSSVPTWLAVELEIGKCGEVSPTNLENSVQAIRDHLKRNHDPLAPHSPNKRIKSTRKTVRFMGDGSEDAKFSAASTCTQKSNLAKAVFSSSWNDPPPSLKMNSSVSDNSTVITSFEMISSQATATSCSSYQGSSHSFLPDFCKQHDLCEHISKWSRTTLTTTDACIGYLGIEQTSSHRVLVTQPVNNHTPNPKSLAQLISSAVEGNYKGRFLCLDIVRLAKQLASAILVFHGTPLLRESWQSEDIIFYDRTTSSRRQRPSLTDPHLSVHVTDTTLSCHQQNPLQPKPSSHDRNIRNFHTYRLGVILLELGYQTPFSKLREEEDILQSPQNGRSNRDLEVANLISETLCTDMGAPFQKIVQKCLNCDFGNGTDLKSSGLQAAFQRDIVGELERIEERLSGLQLED